MSEEAVKGVQMSGGSSEDRVAARELECGLQ
jgi:hypothetical protein